MNLTPPPPSQNSHAVRWHCTAKSKQVYYYYYYYYAAGLGCQCGSVYRVLVGLWIFCGLAWLAGVTRVVQHSMQNIAASIESRLLTPAPDNDQVCLARHTGLASAALKIFITPERISGSEKNKRKIIT